MRKRDKEAQFTGVPRETLDFLRELGENNDRGWFNDNRHRYETYYLNVAFGLVNSLGKQLAGQTKGLQYEARVDKSVYRINRDTRFSKNKSPYKTHIGLIFWKGPFDDRQMNPCYYLHLEAERLILATGNWWFLPEVLAEYRTSLQDKKHSARLLKISQELKEKGIPLEAEFSLKKYARGFDANHPMAEFSRYKGFSASVTEIGLPDIVHTAEFVDYCMAFYSQTPALLDWLVDLANRSVK